MITQILRSRYGGFTIVKSILIADDQEIIRRALCYLFTSQKDFDGVPFPHRRYGRPPSFAVVVSAGEVGRESMRNSVAVDGERG